MHNHVLGASLLAAAAILGSIGTANADLIITPQTTTNPTPPPATIPITDTFKAESGQSIPTGQAGFGNGTLVAEVAGNYTFTFGPTGTGHGDSVLPNEFWVGPRATAVAAGHFFCTQQTTGGDCAGGRTPVGTTFSVTLSVGSIPLVFDAGENADGSGGTIITNGATWDPTNLPRYIDTVGPVSAGGPAVSGPSNAVAFLGLSDQKLPDDDFQDLTLQVTEITTPEPASMAILGSGLVGMAFAYRRRTRKLNRKS